MTPSFTISLDFELRWGIRDAAGADQYNDAILGGRRAIPLILELFAAHGIRATWATVGLLFAETKEELLAHLPDIRPDYKNDSLSPLYDIATWIGRNEADDPLHYGLSLIRQIQDTPGQEIGSHSLSHFFCLEEGGDPLAFGADMAAARQIAQSKNIALQSLVLPRNQLSTPHLIEARQAGIAAFRGTPTARCYRARPRAEERPILRAWRLADSALPLCATLATATWDASAAMVNTPASRFLRPVRSATSSAAKLQRRRIKGEMTAAAKQGKNYHLWWHPHNFGRSTAANLEHLRDVLEHFTHLRHSHGMQPMTMLDLSRTVKGPDPWPST